MDWGVANSALLVCVPSVCGVLTKRSKGLYLQDCAASFIYNAESNQLPYIGGSLTHLTIQ